MLRWLIIWDKRLTTELQGKPKWAYWFMRVASFLGLPAVVVGIGLLAAWASWAADYKMVALAFVVSLVASAVASALKLVLRRARPDTLYVEKMWMKSFSFPSGHSFGALMNFSTLSFWALIALPESGWIVASGLWLLILAIGYARVYLGAHYVGDVLGAWIIGVPVVMVIASMIFQNY